MKKVQQQDVEKLLGCLNESLIPAVGYCRFSSDMQREESIEAQQRFISEYAERNGYKITEWYIDRAYSGKTDKRPSFIQLIDDVKKSNCPFKAVIVHKTDRFSRNSADAIKYKDILQDNNIQLISTAEHIDNTANGKLVYGIMSTINQYYIDNLSNEVMKGLKENAYNLKFNGGKPPLGFDIVDGKYVINETEVIIVRTIFQMAADGCGYNTIIR
ncbi:MAG: recombinase family protein, partial [Clostridia bacterium]|nr:recombinase family protein [Clostridia bacterium]